MVQSVRRALVILEMLADETPELGVTQIGARLDVHKSTASRLLATLQEHDLVEENPATGKFRLSFGLVRLAGAVAGSQDLVREARPLLQKLADETRETVSLTLLEADHAVSIHQIGSPHLVANVDWVGRRTPLHCTSSGKVFLAHMSPERREGILTGVLERLTPRTVVDPVELRRELERVRETGYGFTNEELEVGLSGVAAPVRSGGGHVVAAVSVAGPSFRVTQERIPDLSIPTKRAADGMSRRLVFMGGGRNGS
jgi:DNA-binding IclR family transcriptional regulator